MPRMRILTLQEQEEFEKPPVFNYKARKSAFTLPYELIKYAKSLVSPNNAVFFLTSCAYFKVTKRFFASKDFSQSDVKYAAKILDFRQGEFEHASYSKTSRVRNENYILNHYGFKRFDKEANDLISDEITNMIRNYQKTKNIFCRCIEIPADNKILIQSYNQIADLISLLINQQKWEMSKLVEQNLPFDLRQSLDQLLHHDIEDSENKKVFSNTPHKLTLLKSFSHSVKSFKIKDRVLDLIHLKNLYSKIDPILTKLNITHEGMKYLAGSVMKSKIFQLNQRSDPDKYLLLITFISDRYFKLQDNLIDVLLSVVQTFQNTSQREHKDAIYENRKNQPQIISNLLSKMELSYNDVLRKIKEIAVNPNISDSSKIEKIQALLGKESQYTFQELKLELSSNPSLKSYYDTIEKRSVKLQNKLSSILKAITFKAENAGFNLMEAIKHYQDTDGNITKKAPLGFLDEDQREVVFNVQTQKLRTSLYKAFLFIHIAGAIKSGNLNLDHSYKYLPLDSYMISKERWKKEKYDLIAKAGLEAFIDPNQILKELDDKLFAQYQNVNSNVICKENFHIKFDKKGKFNVTTPAIDSELEEVANLFPSRHIVPLTEILSTVNAHSGFLKKLEHWQQKYIRQKHLTDPYMQELLGLVVALG